MKVAHVVDSVSRNAGGVFFSVNSLAHALSRREIDVSVHGLRDGSSEADAPAWAPLSLRIHAPMGPRGLGFSPSLTKALLAGEDDLLHVHGAWQAQSHSVNVWHRRTRRPYLISLHGMLDPWALSRSRGKKWLAALAYERAHLRHAACLHALCGPERDSIRRYGLKQPVCLIPNGVDLPETDAAILNGGKGNEPRTLLFLGRLHPKKGLVNALRAWARVMARAESGAWRFIIAGWDQGGHGEELKSLCRELGLSFSVVPEGEAALSSIESREGSVMFHGPVFGEAKEALLRRADAFILPSFSEGLPMAVLEAWAHALPVLMTDFCNLPEGFAAGAALRIGTDAETIAEGLNELFEGSATDQRAMGARGRRLVEERFTWPRVAAEMEEVYRWLVGGGSKPGCVS